MTGLARAVVLPVRERREQAQRRVERGPGTSSCDVVLHPRAPRRLGELGGQFCARRLRLVHRQWACKPSSVPRSRAAAVIPLGAVLPRRSSCRPGSTVGHRWRALAGPPGSLLGIAPDGVYRADARHRGRGALLPHLFTLTASRPKALRAAVCSLWHCPSGRPAWPLASILPCGARTFLPRRNRRSGHDASDRSAHYRWRRVQ